MSKLAALFLTLLLAAPLPANLAPQLPRLRGLDLETVLNLKPARRFVATAATEFWLDGQRATAAEFLDRCGTVTEIHVGEDGKTIRSIKARSKQ